MSIELSKILTVSARDYVESQGKVMSNYEMVGVGVFLQGTNNGAFSISPKTKFAEAVPKEAEVVVDYRSSAFHNDYDNYDYCEVNGTALIPRKLSSINELVSEDANN